MTRSVTIVNTSNWQHEDVQVVATSAGGHKRVTLEPGDKMTVGPYGEGESVAVSLVASLPAEAVPFKDADGNQDWPRVDIHKPKPSEPDA